MRALVAALLVGLAAPLGAQDLFSPVIQVNDRVVTGYELDQRVRLLTLFDTPGDIAAQARTDLVDERLKRQEMDRVGVSLTDEGLDTAIADLAGRAGLDSDAFLAQLEGGGVAYETLRDYVGVNAAWRDYVRARFGDRVEVTEADVDVRMGQEAGAGLGIEVLLSEIIIPASPPQAAQVDATALAISRTTSLPEFEAAARQYSATPSREQGGRLDWTPVANYPAPLRDLLLSLAPGQVTPPLALTGAVALLQLRDVREGSAPATAPTEVDYAVLRIPGGLTAPALAEASRVAAEVDACDDLYGVAQGLAPDRLLRETVPPEAIPADVALALAALDRDEATWGLTADDGRTLLFVMLCSRGYPLPEGAADRDAVAGALRSERLSAYSDAVVADLRAAATIVGE